MSSRTETIHQTYRGHPYEVTLQYTQKFDRGSLVSEHLTKAGVYVDGKRIYGGTPGFVMGGSDAPHVKIAVIQYIDYLEQELEDALKP